MKMASRLIDLISKKKKQKNKQIARVAYFFFGRSIGRSVYGHVITKFSRMGRLPHFLTYGAPCTHGASRLAWSSANNNNNNNPHHLQMKK